MTPLLAGRIERFRAATLYPVISPEFCAGRDPLDVLRVIGEAGAKVVQLRWKTPESDAALLRMAQEARKITQNHGMLLIIDDRIDIAVGAEADGVHLGQDDIPVPIARRIAPELLIGVSTHNLAEIRAAHRDGAGYLNVGPIFPTATKSVSYPTVGVEALKRLIPEITMPFSVMGGIKAHNIGELRALGVRRPAMVTEITAAADVRAKTVELLTLIDGKDVIF